MIYVYDNKVLYYAKQQDAWFWRKHKPHDASAVSDEWQPAPQQLIDEFLEKKAMDEDAED